MKTSTQSQNTRPIIYIYSFLRIPFGYTLSQNPHYSCKNRVFKFKICLVFGTVGGGGSPLSSQFVFDLLPNYFQGLVQKWSPEHVSWSKPTAWDSGRNDRASDLGLKDNPSWKELGHLKRQCTVLENMS